MELHKIIIKLFVENDTFGLTEFVPIFHQWIQRQALPNHLLIDVADYAHVPDGPGTLLIADEANIHMDRTNGQLGLLYMRKRPMPGNADFAARLRGVLQEAVIVADLLETEPTLAGRLKFSRSEVLVRLNDRLLAPNTAEAVARYEPIVVATVAEVLGQPSMSITTNAASPRELLQFRVTAGKAG